MDKKEQELRQERTETAKKMAVMLDKAEDEKRSLTDEEKVEYDKMNERLDQIKEFLERKEKVNTTIGESDKIIEPIHRINIDKKMEVDPEKEFCNIGEYFYTIATNPYDERLEGLHVEKRELQMGVGSKGGYALPDQFRPEIWQVQPQEAIVRPRATVLPAGDPPDAKLEMPALDQTSGSNIYGGVTITHTGEAITMTETSAALRQMTLEPKEMSAYIVVTNKLLANWAAASAFISGQLRKAMIGQEDYDFMRGDGINKALGFINAPCAVTVARSASNTIAYADIYGMFARLKMGGSPLWVASQTTIPQLVTIVDAGSHAIWVGGGNITNGIAAAMPATLFGIPIMFADRLPALGTKGDINLVDLSYYIIKDGSGPIAGVSTELLFLSNRTVFKIVWNVDAKPWLTEAIALEGSSTSTVSPFINLS